MPTPLYNTDIIPLTSRPTLTVMDDGDYFVILDTSTGKISKILRTDVQKALSISYDNANSGLTATQVQAALDELVVNLGSSDSAISALGGRLDTLESDDTTEGSVLKSIKDNAEDATYDNTDSGLTASTIKTAIDEVEGRVDTAESEIDELQTAETAIKGTGWTDENLVDHEVRLQILEFMPHVSTWADVQSLVRAGYASAYFHVGTQFNALWNGVERTLEVIGIDHDTPTDTAYTHSLTLQFKDILSAGRISGPEAMYNAVTELPAGTYIFTTNALQYTFTSAQAVPAGGVIYIKTRDGYAPLTLTIYGANRTSIIEDDIVVTPTTGTDNLTPINNHVRMRYGSNLYEISAIRQWLNSEDSAFTWQPLGLYDMPSSYTTEGFIYLLDEELQAVIGAVDKQVARSNYDGGGQDTFSDKVFLLSRKEIFGNDEGVVTGEVVYPFWDGSSNADRIKGSPSNWWLRSPRMSSTHSTRVVGTAGGFNDLSAFSSYGLAPACVIY